MLWLIIRKEIVSHILTLRFGVTFILFLVLIFASIYVSVGEYKRGVAEYNAQVRVGRDVLSDLVNEEDQHRKRDLFYHVGLIDAVPLAPLSWMAQGLQPGYPVAVNSKTWESLSLGRGLTRNPLLGILRVPDFVYVVNIVLSFLAILFMFDSVCGEKESGTLRLVLSNSVPRHTLLLGKWLGGYIVLMVPFLAAVCGGLGYAWSQGVLDLSGDSVSRVCLMCVVASLYIAVFFNVSVFISTTTRRSSTALLLCLLVWVGFILAIPNIAPITARILRPTPSLRKIAAEKDAVWEEVRLEVARLSLKGTVRYGKEREEAEEELWEKGRRRVAKWDKYYEDMRSSQLSLAGILGRLSPSGCWTYAAVLLSNTGPEMFDRLQNSRSKLRSDLKNFADGLWTAARKNPERRWPEFSAEEVPFLQMTFPNVREAVTGVLNDVLLLIILNVVFFMLGFVFFLRYNVT